MKKIRIIALVLALIAVCFCFASCETGGNDAEETGADGFAKHMTIKITVYSSIDPETNEKYADGDSPILGAANGISIGYNEGDKVTPKTALEAIAKERKAEVTFTSTDSVDTIVYDKTTYKSTRILNKDRKGTQKSQSGEKYDVYYYDLVMWEWTLNGEAIASVKETELKDGDVLKLRLVYDDTSTTGFEKCEDVDGAATSAAE